ncbi:MAG TPA: apolipoprotein N-acyltransferase, partial [Sedimentisphaerales bacterium]|nr:apolipoprotein N-acyltransferase [Sedimentisphaerales bacterium]
MMESADRKNCVSTVLLLVVSGVLLSVIQAPADAWFLAWVAVVPFIMASVGGASTKRLLLSAYVVGAVYWIVNTYWLIHVTLGGWLGLGLYLGLYWPVMAYALNRCSLRKIPLWLSVPVIFTGAEAFQGWVFTGFAWRYLAHSQYMNPRMIQIADIFGAAGVSFLIAMVNGFAADILTRVLMTRRFSPGSLVRLIAALALVGAAAAYGTFRINESDQYIKPGPVVAAVQTNVLQRVKDSGVAGHAILDEMLRYSREAAQANPALIVWPETMVTGYLNPELLAHLPQDHEMRQFDRAIRDFAGEGHYVLVGALAATPAIENGHIVADEKFNSAFLYLPDGTQSPLRYDKMHLVPFGEFVPFRQSIPWLYRLLLRLTPHDYEYNLTPGVSPTHFEIRAMDRTYRFGVIICYEGTVPQIARSLVYGQDGHK